MVISNTDTLPSCNIKVNILHFIHRNAHTAARFTYPPPPFFHPSHYHPYWHYPPPHCSLTKTITKTPASALYLTSWRWWWCWWQECRTSSVASSRVPLRLWWWSASPTTTTTTTTTWNITWVGLRMVSLYVCWGISRWKTYLKPKSI